MQHTTTPRPRRLRAGFVIVATIAAAAPITACLPGSGPSFAEGDCVKVDQQIIDSDLVPASCEDAVGTFDAAQRTYRIDSILDGTDGGCPQLSGFFPVEFVHEPDGVTYCLVQES
jgi:hypothetical protein